MPYQQLHLDAHITLPAALGRPAHYSLRLRTALSIAMVTAGVGLGLGSFLTVAALNKVEAANGMLETAHAVSGDMPPLPQIPVRGVSSGQRLRAYPASKAIVKAALWPHMALR